MKGGERAENTLNYTRITALYCIVHFLHPLQSIKKEKCQTFTATQTATCKICYLNARQAAGLWNKRAHSSIWVKLKPELQEEEMLFIIIHVTKRSVCFYSHLWEKENPDVTLRVAVSLSENRLEIQWNVLVNGCNVSMYERG